MKKGHKEESNNIMKIKERKTKSKTGNICFKKAYDKTSKTTLNNILKILVNQNI
jgi:hypothetical protein